jgi:exodeoxyribonuclease III
VLSLLTINIGAAALTRAEAILEWLATRTEDVFILTETSSGAGTAHLTAQFAAAGYAVRHTPDSNGDRGVAIVSRVPILESTVTPMDVSLPCRAALMHLATEPRTAILGVYVPSRDRSLDKTQRKDSFIRSLLAAVERLPADVRDHLIVGGDYNVIGRSHYPRHSGFLPFEYGLLDTFTTMGLMDAYETWAPGDQQYSWVGRTGDGYRYDYFHFGRNLLPYLAGCTYLQETRETRLTDHAAVTVAVSVEVSTRLDTRDPRTESEPMALF